MSPLTVPEKDRKPLGDLATLPGSKIKAFLRALAEAAPTLLLADLAREVAQKARLPESDALELLRTSAVLHSARARSGMDVEEFVEGVCDAAEDTGVESLRLKGVKRAAFKHILKQILSYESLYVTSKALDVMLENAHLWCVGRIVTDLRPIFGDDDEPAAAIITHTLRIKYHEGAHGPRKDFFVALTSNDIEQLLHLLQRAQRKEASLKHVAVKADLQLLEVERK